MLELIKEIIARLDYPALNTLTSKDKWLNMTSGKNQNSYLEVRLQDSHSIESAVSTKNL